MGAGEGSGGEGRDVGKGRVSLKRPGWLQGWSGAEPARVIGENVKSSNACLLRRLHLIP